MQLVSHLINWLICSSVGWFVTSLVSQPTSRLVGCLSVWLVLSLAGQGVGRSASQSVGWFVS